MVFRNHECKICVSLVVLLCICLNRVFGDISDLCEETIDISDGEKVGSNIIKDGVTFSENDYFINGNVITGCICKVKKCIRRCCLTNELLIEIDEDNISCQQINSTAIDITDDLNNVIDQDMSLYHIISVPDRQICIEEGEYKIFLDSDEKIDSSGLLYWDEATYAFDKFCAANLNNHLGVFVCVRPDVQINSLVYCIGMIISMPFLLITFLVYAILPDTNLHQRALMFYVLTLLLSYILMVAINLSTNIAKPWCDICGYSTLYFFMSSFFWMNVICFDIWYTFSGGRGFVGSKRTSERKKLFIYSLYAFGVPLLVVNIVILMQKTLPTNSPHNPGIGVGKCFLADGWPNLWYFYGEAIILVVANIAFFFSTAFKIRQVKKETSMLKHNDSKRHSFEKDKQKFNLYLKLLFAMGANWTMEVISWVVNWRTGGTVQYIWYATDFFNAISGVFIFFMFVFKKKVWKLLQRRYYNFIGKPHLAHTMTSTNTRTSHYSSTNYSTADTNLSDRTTATNGRTRAEEIALRRAP